MQVDVSQVGLNAVFLQGGKPVAYASKALTPAEVRNASIKRKMLALMLGLCSTTTTSIAEGLYVSQTINL